jgi:hypothetical protein
MVSVTLCHLLSTSFRNHFCKFCITCCCMVGEIVASLSLMFRFKSIVVLGLFSYTLLLRYPHRKTLYALRSGDLTGHLREIKRLGTSCGRLTLQSSHCEPLPCLAENRESGFQHQVSASSVLTMYEASRCSRLNLQLLPCLLRLQRNMGRSPPKILHHTKQ